MKITDMTLEDIFKTKPELLQEAEVQKLIEYAKEQHLRRYKICKNYQDFHDKVLEMCMYSNVILKEGKSADDTLKSIFELLEKT